MSTLSTKSDQGLITDNYSHKDFRVSSLYNLSQKKFFEKVVFLVTLLFFYIAIYHTLNISYIYKLKTQAYSLEHTL